MVSKNPAKLFNLNEGSIEVGKRAKLILINKSENEPKFSVKKVFIF
jgi:alpha-D-ribose 1-methylphosphonate 5-triphosphate diphosphatase PhnM